MSRAIKQFSALRYSRRLLFGGIGTSVCYGAFAANSSVRLDSRRKQSTASPTQYAAKPVEPLPSPEIIRQVSSGSVVGFATGLVVSVFSRTLVLLGGVLTACYHLASSYGLPLPRFLNLPKYLAEKFPLLSYSTRDGWFVASFVLTFVLSAFVSL
ncbi:uncharacterized protein TrAtP1_009891 [Trichoderma atroviride]|uniref:Uncharacterized protein n=1 Tax=Hypocrea atroviridis (strain ATCC 20476 / IMI 206040) TaxID=452589 RepID=G9NEF7_HYPAI|nr:uncharacterized protein TRIATDRAFT_279710 [Trichoderma atroviride IMI 206040]EHK51063.1 hypothetical protein TRIATDRAFT_279710 [Trichoderma atroviride IMI 206040]UKZ68871.1 hypothetical protein TrAtP1_009891 [Trichoderma atroviride]